MGKKSFDHDDNFEIELDYESSVQIYRKPKKQMKYEKGASKGIWSQEEKFKYLAFFEALLNKNIFSKRKKMNMIFKMMSQYMQTRNLLQCRSHHQKMIEKFGGLRNIISKVKAETPQVEYQAFFQGNRTTIEAIYQQYKSKGLIHRQNEKNSLPSSPQNDENIDQHPVQACNLSDLRPQPTYTRSQTTNSQNFLPISSQFFFPVYYFPYQN